MIIVAWLCFLIVHLRLAWVCARLGILPDNLTLTGGMAGFIFSAFCPALQQTDQPVMAMWLSGLGAIAGYLTIWFIREAMKAFFGWEKLRFREAVPMELRIYFPEAMLRIGDQEWHWADLFPRESDRLKITGCVTVELPEELRTTGEKAVFSIDDLWLAEKKLYVPKLQLVSGTVTEADLPREFVGFGVLKMALFAGAFLGPIGVLQYIGWTALIASLIGAYQAIRDRQVGVHGLPRIDMGLPGAIAAVILILFRTWPSWH